MYEFLRYVARDVLTADPVTIGPDATLREAEAVFQARSFNALPVMEDGRLVGWVTKLDILRAFRFSEDSIFPQYELIMERPVRAVMTPLRDVVRVTSRAPLARVLEKMIRCGAKSLPVVDGDDLVGVIAREDLLQALRRATRVSETAPA